MQYFPFRRKRSEEGRQPRFRRSSSENPQSNSSPSPSPSPGPSVALGSDRRGSSPSIRHINRLSSNQHSRKRSAIDFGPLGLNVIFTPENSQKVDIVFIHGLGGTSRKTWSKNGDPELFWPLKFLPLEPYICLSRILTFGYNANFLAAGNISTSVLDFAKDLLFDLKFAKDDRKEDLNIGKVPLVFVVHSMGGLIIKEAYMQGQNDPEYEVLIKAISAVTFLATPHRGTNLAELLNRILRSTLFTSSKNYISELGKNSFTLQKLNEQFRHIAPRLDIISFYETRPTSIGLKNSRVMVLEKDSSILGYPGERSKALDADHHDVCKYDSPQDPNYVAVKNSLQSIIAKIISASGSTEDTPYVGKRLDSAKIALGLTELPDTDYISFRDQWSQGTCNWLLDDKDYLEWLRPSVLKPALFWLSGGAATGKSVLSSFVINDITDKGLCCQYFFIRFGDRRKRSLSLLLRSIIFQVAMSKPSLVEQVLRLKDQGIDFETATPRNIWERIFKAFLFKPAEEEEPNYLVIDGLDEADDPGAMIRMFSEVSGSSMPIRILFVGRETPETAASFRKIPSDLEFKQMSIEGQEEDLTHYVRHELTLPGDHNFRENILGTVVRESRNNFLWVRLAVETLNLCHSREDIENALEQLPIGMQAFYDRMAMSVAQKTDSAQKALATAVLQSVVTTSRVLSIIELSQALNQETFGILDFQRSIVEVCSGFIVVDRDGYVAVVHHTAREYLLSGVNRYFPIERNTAHKQTFLGCMRYLVAVGVRAKISSNQQPVFFNYAASSWHVHLAAAPVDDREVAETLNKFLSGRWVLIWIQVLASTDQLRVLIQASRYLSKYLSKQRQNDDTHNERQPIMKRELAKSWVEDFTKIAGKFGAILRQNPEAIYKLIPPFCPPDSVIYQQFGKLRDKSLVVSGFSSQNWDDSLGRLSYGLGTYAASISAIGAQIATLVPSGTVLLHDSSNFEETVASPIKHGERLYTMASNSSATLLATYGYRTVKIWETRTGKCKLSIDNLQSRPRPLAMLFLSNDQSLLIGSDDRRIISLDLTLDRPDWRIVADLEEPELEGHFLNSPNHMALDQKGKLISVAYRGHPLSAWEVDGPVHIGHCWRTRDVLARGEVIEAAWHPHLPEIIGLYIEGVIFRWRPYDDETEEVAAGASRLAMSTDGSLLITGDVRGTVKVFATTDFTTLYQLASEGNVLGLAFSPDLRRFYDVRGNYGNVWEPNVLLKFVEQQNKDIEGESEIGSIAQTSNHSESTLGRIDSVTSIATSPNGLLYCSGTEQGAVHLYDTGKGKVATIYKSRGFLSIEQMIWDNDGRYVCFVDSSKRVFIKTVDPVVSTPDESVNPTAPDFVKTDLDGPITQLLIHSDSTQLMVCSSSSVCTLSLKSTSIIASANIGMAGSRWTFHPQDPSLMLCIGPSDIQFFDWSLRLHQAFKIERPFVQNTAFHLQDQEEVRQILSTADGKHLFVQLERAKEKILLLLDSPSSATAAAESAERPENSTSFTTIVATELPASFSSQIYHALDLLPSGNLVFLSRDFSVCSIRMPIQDRVSSLPMATVLESESDSQHEAADAMRPSKTLSSFKDTKLYDAKPLFWLPRDWISRDCLALCMVWRKERSFLCPRNGEIAVVKCTAMV